MLNVFPIPIYICKREKKKEKKIKEKAFV